MASTCSICIQQKKTSIPFVWCEQCEKVLCQSCTDDHNRSKTQRKHNVIPYQDYKACPPFILNTQVFCSEHGERYTHYCRMHDKAICIKCRKKSHSECEDVPKIEDIVHNVKDSVLFENTISEFVKMCGTLNNIADNRNKNLQMLNNTRDKMKAGFTRRIDNFISTLKKLKKATISEIDSVHYELANDLSNTLQIVQSKENELRTILNQVGDMKRLATNYQTFLAIKKMECILHGTITKLNEFTENEKLLEYNLKYDDNEITEDIVRGGKTLGEIRVIKSQSEVSTYVSKPTEAQKSVTSRDRVQLHLQQTIDLEKGSSYRACCTLHSGHMVFADSGDFSGNNCKLGVYNSSGALKSTIRFKKSEGVYDVTPVHDKQVVVSHPKSLTISIVNLSCERVVRTISMDKKVFGLSCRDRDIVCCVLEEGLVSVNIESEKKETVLKDSSIDWGSQIKVNKNMICYTNPTTHTVTVLNTQYKVVFTYKDPAVLSSPRGVTIDDHNYIYVTGFGTNNLLVISPDFKSCHQFLGSDDGLSRPTAVNFEKSQKKLTVVNVSGPALVFSVEQVRF